MEDKRGKEFEQIAKPNANGVSDPVYLEKLPKELQVTNGSNYTRKDSYLDKIYYLEKNYKKEL